MKRLAKMLLALAALLTNDINAATGPFADQSEYTMREIKKLARDAHTIEQYTILADYYATTQRTYKRQAAKQMHLWAERNTMITALSEKWPRPVDSARNRHDHLEYKANQAARQQAKYNRLADELAAKQEPQRCKDEGACGNCERTSILKQGQGLELRLATPRFQASQ